MDLAGYVDHCDTNAISTTIYCWLGCSCLKFNTFTLLSIKVYNILVTWRLREFHLT